MSTWTRALAVTTIAPLLLAVAACGDDDQAPEQGPVTSEDRAGTTAGDPTDGSAGGLDIAERAMAATAAVDAAEQDAGGTGFGLSFEDDGWEVDVLVDEAPVEVRVDAAGAVVDTRPAEVDDTDREALSVAGTTLQTAIALAADSVNAPIDEVELEREGDAFVWQVQFEGPGDEQVAIDVATGELLRIETDD